MGSETSNIILMMALLWCYLIWYMTWFWHHAPITKCKSFMIALNLPSKFNVPLPFVIKNPLWWMHSYSYRFSANAAWLQAFCRKIATCTLLWPVFVTMSFSFCCTHFTYTSLIFCLAVKVCACKMWVIACLLGVCMLIPISCTLIGSLPRNSF